MVNKEFPTGSSEQILNVLLRKVKKRYDFNHIANQRGKDSRLRRTHNKNPGNNKKGLSVE